MLAIQLNAFNAPVVVDLEAICDLYLGAAAHLRILRRTANVSKGDGLDGIGGIAARRLQLHFQMFAANDPRVDDAEISVEHRLRKALSPGARPPKHARRVERKLCR